MHNPDRSASSPFTTIMLRTQVGLYDNWSFEVQERPPVQHCKLVLSTRGSSQPENCSSSSTRSNNRHVCANGAFRAFEAVEDPVPHGIVSCRWRFILPTTARGGQYLLMTSLAWSREARGAPITSLKIEQGGLAVKLKLFRVQIHTHQQRAQLDLENKLSALHCLHLQSHNTCDGLSQNENCVNIVSDAKCPTSVP